jgi:hypothetical protein
MGQYLVKATIYVYQTNQIKIAVLMRILDLLTNITIILLIISNHMLDLLEINRVTISKQ